MKKINIKNKYFLLTGSLFLLVSFPVWAKEITTQSVIDLVNQSRQENNLLPLQENETLKKVAQDKLEDMIKNHYFAHTSPTGINPWFWFSKENYDYKYAGENLAINFLEAEEQHKAWMESLTHRKNILNEKFQQIGVAVGAGEIDGQNSIIAVQEFGALVDAKNNLSGQEFFSANQKNVLKKEEKKIIPQALQTQKDSNWNLGENDFFMKDFFAQEKGINFKGEMAVVLAMILVFIPIALMPITFISLGISLIIELEKKKKYPTVQVLKVRWEK